MEQEIASQVVGLGGSSDFSFKFIFKSRFCREICYYNFDCCFNIFLGR